MINVSMWGRAIRIIPRVSSDEWDDLDIISRWLIATRAAVFLMTVLSAMVAGLLAFRDGMFSWNLFVPCLFGLVFAHATNNLLNDLTDHKRGIDKDNYFRSQYGPQPLEHGLMTIGQLWRYIFFSGFVALAVGLFLVYHTGWITLSLLFAGAFFVLFYTWPLKYIGLGEPAVLLVWGPLMVGGTYFVATAGQWNWDIILISIVYAAGPTTVLFGKHTDKLPQDKAKRVYTLPVLIGEKAARLTTIGLWIFQYVLISYLIVIDSLGLAMAAVVVALPKLISAVKVFVRPRPKEAPEDLPENVWPLYLSAHAFVYNRYFGIVFLIALIADVTLSKLGLY